MKGCWIWTGSQASDGYGTQGRDRVHRLAWEWANGRSPRGLVIHHKCERKLCYNPAHLQATTHSQHTLIHRGGSGEPGYCSRGHHLTRKNRLLDYRGRIRCRVCVMVWRAEWRRQNRELIIQRNRLAYWTDPEKFRARKRAEYASKTAARERGKT